MAGGSPGKVQPYVGEGAEPGDLEGTKYSGEDESESGSKPGGERLKGLGL